MKLRLLAGLMPAVLTPLILTSCHSGDPIGATPPGPTWTTVARGSLDYLDGIWGSSASDVWAVGGASNYGVILHYTGTSWTTSWSSVPLGTSWFVGAVWGTSPSDVWAVGATASGGGSVHYDGTAWTVVPTGTTETLYGVWGTSTSDVWAVGVS